jgi:membrane protein DedA with SNARE-associated domain
VFGFLFDLLSSPWAYGIVLGIAALDAVFPAVPSESLAITAGVLAGVGKLHVAPTIAAAAGGAFLGDTGSYVLGRTLGRRVRGRLFRGKRSQRALGWAERTLEQRGGYLIVVARFIPGGRTATTFTAGFVETFPWHRFLRYDAIAGAIWGAYTVLLGYFGGKSFEQQPWKGLLLAFAIALLVTGVVEAVRHLRARRRRA